MNTYTLYARRQTLEIWISLAQTIFPGRTFIIKEPRGIYAMRMAMKSQGKQMLYEKFTDEEVSMIKLCAHDLFLNGNLRPVVKKEKHAQA